MMQCRLHQTSWIDQDFSGGECSECTKERRERIQHINKLTAEKRELSDALEEMVLRFGSELDDELSRLQRKAIERASALLNQYGG